MKKIIIIVVAVLALGIGAFVFFTQSSQPKALVPFTHDPGDYFITDIKGSNQLLKADIMIYVADDSIKLEIEEKNHIIRNDIIFILRSMTAEQLKAEGIQDQLSASITARLNQEFENEDFLKIYFNEFVIQ